MRSIIADKRGISELISYVLLTVMAIALASGVYIWIKTRIPYDYKECPEGLSMIIEECTIKEQIPNSFELNLTFKNTGNFNITGAFVYAVLSNGSITNLTTFPSNLSYLDADYLPVGEKRIYPDNQPYVLIPHNTMRVEYIPLKGVGGTVLCQKMSYPVDACEHITLEGYGAG